MQHTTLNTLECCLEALQNYEHCHKQHMLLEAMCEHVAHYTDGEFLDVRWRNLFSRKQKIQPLPQTGAVQTTSLHQTNATQNKVSGEQRRMALDPIASFDYDLKLAYVYGRIMLEHIQKMTELYHAYTKAGYKIIGEWGTTSHVLMAKNPTSTLNFSVFWFSYGQFYIFSDKNGYIRLKTVNDVMQYILKGKGKGKLSDKRDVFFDERIKAMFDLNEKIRSQMHSRFQILREFSFNQLQMTQLGYSLSVKGSNIFNPLEGIRRVGNDIHHFHIFFDNKYKFFEFDSQNNLKKRIESDNVSDLFQKIRPNTAQILQRHRSLPNHRQKAHILNKAQSMPSNKTNR
jgi:hypothetical protein